MKREDLIKRCRYYKGEKEYPGKGKDDSGFGLFFWEAEQMYCEHYDDKEMQQTVDDYMREGLTTSFLDIPLGLAACLFSVFCHIEAHHDILGNGVDFKSKFMPKYLVRPL